MQIDIKLEGVEQALRMVNPDKVRRAANTAIKRVATGARAKASKLITGGYNIRAKRVRDFLRVEIGGAKCVQMEAVIWARGLGMPLGYFDPKQAGYKLIKEGAGSVASKYLYRTKRKRGNVTVKVKKGGGRKTVSAKYGNKPFIAVMKSGHIGVFVRTGQVRENPRYRGDQAIEELYSVDVGGLFQSRRIMDEVKKYIADRWPNEFNHQLAYYLK